MRLLSLLVALSGLNSTAQDGVLARVAAHEQQLGAVSRQIWEAAELGYHERTSSTLLQDELRRAGFSIQSDIAGMPTAFIATWGNGKPIVGVLGEFDALPGLSQKDLPRQEPLIPGAAGHGCGHNLLGAGSALALIAAKEHMQSRRLSGTIKYFGTPAEEGGGGKIYLLHGGHFKDVDVVLAWHPGDRNGVNLRSCLASSNGTYRFSGTASHAGSAPERGRSALDGALLMLHCVELLREHVPQETRLHYVISNGGGASNIVPASSEITLRARHPDAATLDGILGRILKCGEAGAIGTDTRIQSELISQYANLLPNEALATLVARNMQKAGGYQYNDEESSFVAEIRKTLPNDGPPRPNPDEIATDLIEGVDSYSTDVGDVSWNVPTLQFFTATYVPGTAAHSWQAAAAAGTSIGRKGMAVAARTMALSIIDLVSTPSEIAAAKTAFEKRKAGRKWATRIAPDAKPPLNYLMK